MSPWTTKGGGTTRHRRLRPHTRRAPRAARPARRGRLFEKHLREIPPERRRSCATFPPTPTSVRSVSLPTYRDGAHVVSRCPTKAGGRRLPGQALLGGGVDRKSPGRCCAGKPTPSPFRLGDLAIRHEQREVAVAGRARGTGLGLVILVEAHGGRIEVESGGEGEGTRVTFTTQERVPGGLHEGPRSCSSASSTSRPNHMRRLIGVGCHQAGGGGAREPGVAAAVGPSGDDQAARHDRRGCRPTCCHTLREVVDLARLTR